MTKFLAVTAAVMTAGFLAGSAWADGDGYASPVAESYSLDWLGLFCFIVMLVATLALGFKTAKRTRVD